MIPKIIHQTAPKGQENWHPLWRDCYNSWKENFREGEFRYLMWDDESLDSFMKKNYPEYMEYYNNLPFHIMKIDFFRCALLYKYGGIYADMDMYCYTNFYDELKEDGYILQSSPGSQNEKVSNALMASIPGNKFFKDYMDICVEIYEDFPYEVSVQSIHEKVLEYSDYVISKTGPGVLSELYTKYDKDKISTLDSTYYHRAPRDYDTCLKVRHMNTGIWGKDVFDYVKVRQQYEKFPRVRNMTSDEYMKYYYHSFRDIDLKKFDFYKNYFY